MTRTHVQESISERREGAREARLVSKRLGLCVEAIPFSCVSGIEKKPGERADAEGGRAVCNLAHAEVLKKLQDVIKRAAVSRGANNFLCDALVEVIEEAFLEISLRRGLHLHGGQNGQ